MIPNWSWPCGESIKNKARAICRTVKANVWLDSRFVAKCVVTLLINSHLGLKIVLNITKSD